MHKRLTTEEFIKKAIEIHGDKYDYSLVNYINSKEKVIILCKEHGAFKQTPGDHLTGRGCRHCGIISSGGKRKASINDFILKATELHGEYDYSSVDYKNAHTKIDIICPLHGYFNQTPNGHLAGRGCPKCGIISLTNKLISSTGEFINKAKKVHGDRFDYSMVDYINAHAKVKIGCSVHGEYLQAPYHHIQGSGCPVCSLSSQVWEHSKWEAVGENSKRFDAFKVYVMKFQEDDGTIFYKIGKTFTDVNKRIRDLRAYKPTNIMTIKGTSKFCSKLEIMMHRALKEYRYKPQIKFAGSTECFSHIPDDIFNTLKSFSNA